MTDKGTQDQGSPNAASTDLWKFFEESGAKQKESMFKFVTWMVGFAAVILGFAVKEGFESGLEKIAHPLMLIILGAGGLLVVFLTFFVIRDHGQHINRTFARADAARDGQFAPRQIWEAGRKAEGEPLPRICKELLGVVGVFAVSFGVLIICGIVGLCGLY